MSQRVEWLKRELLVLASDAANQLRHLEQQGVPECVDELALDYDAIAAAARGMLTEHELTNEQCKCVTKLDDYLKQISGAANAHLWTPEALTTSEEWKRIRVLARECLALFSENTN